MQYIGSGGLFAFAAGMNVLLALFILYRKMMRVSAPGEKTTDFVGMPPAAQSTPAMSGLDPRLEADGTADRGASTDRTEPVRS